MPLSADSAEVGYAALVGSPKRLVKLLRLETSDLIILESAPPGEDDEIEGWALSEEQALELSSQIRLAVRKARERRREECKKEKT